MKSWAWDKKNLPMAVTEPSLDLQSVVSAQDIINASITHGIRTAVAATVSVIISRFVQMPEAYWAAIATLIVIQSTLGATLTLSVRELNESILERNSGHGPIIVDLPLQEPSLTTSLLWH